jgi:two-component system response regulator HydG
VREVTGKAGAVIASEGEDGMTHTVLVVDDEASNRAALERLLSRERFEVRHASSGREALEIVRAEQVDLVLTDLKMPGMSGIDVLKAVRTIDSDIEVVVMTAYGTVETAVEAMKEGAYDFVSKPLKRVELLKCLRKALEKRSLIVENRRLRAQLDRLGERGIVGQSGAMRELMAEIEQVAPSDATVLLSGESGTGKGRLAQLLHGLSRRREARLITVNCAAIPEALLESELFGYEAGAFTGATKHKDGRFDLARGGTVFLDEITEMRLPTQVKLLRVLQEGEYERVGGTETVRTDVRVVAATNRDIEREVREGRFREDLFYRLNVIRVQVPALRERFEDVPILAQHFLSRFTAKNDKAIGGFSAEAIEALSAWRWPGNVRELENAVERAVVLCRGTEIGLEDLPPALRVVEGRQQLTFPVGTPLKVVERRMIEETLRVCNGDKNLTASLLGITARTIYRREADWGSFDRDVDEQDSSGRS